jgi:predicted nucleotidyltransferase
MNIILSGITGSQAYGLARPGSDIDMKGIYVAPFRSVLGLNGSVVVAESKTQNNPDREYHEVGKFVKLALKCNPTILEMLFLDEYGTLTNAGRALIDARKYFLSEPAIRGSYGAYAKAQADRLVRRNDESKPWHSDPDADPAVVKARTEKHGRHTMRLLMQGTQLLTTGDMAVNVGDQRDYLFEMGELAGKDPERFYHHYMLVAADFDNIQTKLPQFPNRIVADELLVEIRLTMRNAHIVLMETAPA